MKKTLFLLVLIFLTIACSKRQPDLTVKGKIEGLKKGTIYLKKANDSLLINVDSLVINGNSEFELYSDLESPELFILHLNKNSAEDERISFFADKGITEINTTLKNFAFDAKISGSEQQKVYEEYKTLISKINGLNLDLIKENFDAQKENKLEKLDSIQAKYNNNIKRKYLYTVNFALNNKDSEVAPYLALTELYNAKIKFLDTINNSLSQKVKSSKYGKELQSYIDEIKATEKE